MFGTRWHKIQRDIAARKARTAMVTISIFIGVLGVVTLTAVGDLLVGRMEEDLQPDQMQMLTVGVSPKDGIDPADVDNTAALDTLGSYVGVTHIQGYATERVFWRKPDDSSFLEAYTRAFTDPLDTLPLEAPRLIAGQYATTGQREVVIGRLMADRYGLDVGDPVVLRILRELINNPLVEADIPEETWTVSGIVLHPFYSGDVVNRLFYTTFEDYTYITGQTALEVAMVQFRSFDRALALRGGFESFVETNTPFEVIWSDLEDPNNNQGIQEAKDWTNTLSALAGIAMLVSSFLVTTVIITMVIEQRRQIGVMKSLGATRLDNFAMYTGIAVMYGVIGTVPGVLLGIPAGYYLTDMVADLVNIYLGDFMISWSAVGIGLIMGLVMPFLAALLPVFLGTRVTILQAITDLGLQSRFGRGPVSRLLRRLPVPITLRQAFANIYQRRGRLALTGLTLTLAAGAFMGVTGLFISLNDIIDELFDTFNYDLNVVPVTPGDYDYEAVRTLLADNVAGVEAIFPASIVWAEVEESLGGPYVQSWSMELVGFDPHNDSMQFNLEAGRGWNDDPDRRGIVLTRGMADHIGKWVGDTITVVYEDRRVDLEIIGIDSMPMDDRGFTHWETAAALDGERTPDQYWLRFADNNLSAADVDRRAGDIRELLLHNGIIPRFENQRGYEEENARMVFTVGMVFNMASAVMAAVGAIGLLAMLFISVFERQREIGIMRAVGANSRAIVAQFLTEGLLVGLIAWGLGLPLSYGILRALSDLLPLGEFTFTYPVIAPVLGLAGMLAIATLASLWPSLSAARRTVSDILRYQ
ncbi:MAG: ABC transporter permease [Anaerolineae bacterium]|nr:ABC transporter permease [Anaerolineae bacterium]